jgi:predicted regulator of Ras-like GTPase activity (Roadblock/LC7/MglB family)
MIGTALAALRDVDGVFGSFVVSKTGVLAGRDLPAVFEDRVLGEVGPRLIRLQDTLSAGGQTLDSCVLRFADHRLLVRVLQNGLLCVLTSHQANASALKMAVALTARRVDPEIVDASPAASLTPPPASVSQPPPSVARKQGVYRGHRIP